METGTTITLAGLTVKGKNRIRRGGSTWLVRRRDFDERSNKWRLLVHSISNDEMFWMNELGDQHVQRMNGKDERV